MVTKASPPLSDLVQLLRVGDDDLDAHFQLGLLEAEVQAGNFGIDNTFHHFCFVEKERQLFTATEHGVEPLRSTIRTTCLAKEERKTVYKLLSLRILKARVLSPTRITAYVMALDIAAKLNGSSICWS